MYSSDYLLLHLKKKVSNIQYNAIINWQTNMILFCDVEDTHGMFERYGPFFKLSGRRH